MWAPLCSGASYTLTVTAEHGSVLVSPSKAEYEAGERVMLVPRPQTGYCFSGWTGDIDSQRLALDVRMDRSKSLTAHFDPWTAPIGIPVPEFGILESYQMYDEPGTRHPDLTYQASVEGGYFTHYVDNTATGATDTSNPYGSIAKPRLTTPKSLPAGAVI